MRAADPGTLSHCRAVVATHFDELEQSAPFRLTPPSATLTTKGRRDSCLDPHFDRKEPAMWLRFGFEGGAAEMLAFYRSRLVSDGWAELPYNPSVLGATEGMRFAKELSGWRATVDVDVATERFRPGPRIRFPVERGCEPGILGECLRQCDECVEPASLSHWCWSWRVSSYGAGMKGATVRQTWPPPKPFWRSTYYDSVVPTGWHLADRRDCLA